MTELSDIVRQNAFFIVLRKQKNYARAKDPLSGIPRRFFNDQGTADTPLLRVAAQHRLHVFFAAAAWKEQGPEEVWEFYHKLHAALPVHYRQQLEKADLTWAKSEPLHSQLILQKREQALPGRERR